MSELRAFADNVWVIDGPIADDFGLPFTTSILADAPNRDWADVFDQLAFNGNPAVSRSGFVQENSEISRECLRCGVNRKHRAYGAAFVDQKNRRRMLNNRRARR